MPTVRSRPPERIAPCAEYRNYGTKKTVPTQCVGCRNTTVAALMTTRGGDVPSGPAVGVDASGAAFSLLHAHVYAWDWTPPFPVNFNASLCVADGGSGDVECAVSVDVSSVSVRP